jgi:hypothetical protein
MPRLPLADWAADQVRLTVFPMPGGRVPSDEWWQYVTDSEPDEITINPKTRSGVIQGSWGPGKLILKTEPERIDWILVPADQDLAEFAAVNEFPSLGSACEAIARFSVIAERWLGREDIPDLARIAFGATFVHPEPDRRTGYLRLPDYLPVRVDPESSDFLYQINLPRLDSRSGVEGLRLNRLSKWGVAGHKLVSVVAPAQGQIQTSPTVFATRVELDVNTVPDFPGPISRAHLVDLYRELVSAGQSVVANGVIPE